MPKGAASSSRRLIGVIAIEESKTAAEKENLFWQSRGRDTHTHTDAEEKERIGGIFYPIHCSKVNRCRAAPSQERRTDPDDDDDESLFWCARFLPSFDPLRRPFVRPSADE